MTKRLLILIALAFAGTMYVLFSFQSEEPERKSPAISMVHINRILADPRQYHGRPAFVQGKVVRSLSMGLKIYQIDDNTGKIWVKTTSAVPMKGQVVKVTGTINQVFKLFDRNMVLLEETGS